MFLVLRFLILFTFVLNHSKYTTYDGINIIGIMPGKHRSTSQDKIITLSAHYDTVRLTSGVADNGSGSVALIILAEILTSMWGKIAPAHTIYFVALDQEETVCDFRCL